MNKNQGLKQQLIKEDPVELPMDDLFFDKLHDKIMADVEKTEIKPAVNKWTQPWVFLERQVKYYRPSNNTRTLHLVKLGFLGVSLTLGLAMAVMSLNLFNLSSQNQMANNRQLILDQALANPQDWIEMAASMQNDTDFYADIVNERLIAHQVVDIKL